MFGQSYVMTDGAPAQKTRTAIFYIAETGLQRRQMGDAAAMSWVLTIFLVVLSVGLFALTRDRSEGKSR
jgi:multiple sugar transport system permease protein